MSGLLDIGEVVMATLIHAENMHIQSSLFERIFECYSLLKMCQLSLCFDLRRLQFVLLTRSFSLQDHINYFI
jgi:hypothetical protein